MGPHFPRTPEVLPSALYEACHNRRTAAEEWLLERGASADRNALEAACGVPDDEVAGRGKSLLREKGCMQVLLARDPDLSGWGHTLLDKVCDGANIFNDIERVPDTGMVGLLLDRGVRPVDLIARTKVVQILLYDAGRALAGQMGDWDDLILGVLSSGRVARSLPSSRGETPMAVALRTGNVFAVRALCAFVDGAACNVAAAKAGDPRPSTPLLLAVSAVDLSPAVRTLCVEELIENGALASAASGEEPTPLAAVLGDKPRGARDSSIAALLLARWPAHAPFPAEEEHAVEICAVLPEALAHAKRRADLLRGGGVGGCGGGDGGGLLQALTGKFLERVSSGAEQQGSVCAADDNARFACLRFVEGGGLKRAWVSMRKTHRFPVERVAAAQAALRVAQAANAEAASRTLALLGWLPSSSEAASNANGVARPPPLPAAVGRPRDAPEVKRCIAAHAVRRWHEIGEAKHRAERELRAAEAALEGAAEDTKAAVERLVARQQLDVASEKDEVLT